MNINPHDCKIMLTEPPMNPLKNRQKMIEASLFSKCLQKREYHTYVCIYSIRNMVGGGELSIIFKRQRKLGKILKKPEERRKTNERKMKDSVVM
jgi:hypothetical protein